MIKARLQYMVLGVVIERLPVHFQVAVATTCLLHRSRILLSSKQADLEREDEGINPITHQLT
jgi:hypothetical protein